MEEDGIPVSFILDRRSGHNWIRDPVRSGPWRVIGTGVDGERRVLTSDGARTSFLGKSDHDLVLGFEDPDGFQIRVEVQAAHCDILLWRFAVLDLGSLAFVERVDFPFLGGLAQPPGDPKRSYIAFPFEQGILIRDPRLNIFENEKAGFRVSGSYPGNYSMQFMAYGSSGGPGLYFAAHDPSGSTKRFVMERGGDGKAVFFIENYLPDPRRPGPLAYPAAISAYEGTWLDAAKIYAIWALQQGWCSRGKLSRGRAPAWVHSTPAWIWNRGRAAQVVEDAILLSEYLGLPAALDWYWWHRNPYDTMLPEYLPPRDGEEPFRQAVCHLHERGLRCVVYINGRCCDLESRRWREESSVRKPSGQIETETYCRYTGARLAVMCPKADHWKAELARIVSEIMQYGVNGVYIDQVSSAPPKICFSNVHGHPVGGPSAWAEGNRSILEAARSVAKAKNPDAMLCSEGCCEVYMDLLDAFLTLSPSFERMGMFGSFGDSWEPIPMFNSVYHEFVLTFGSYASLANPPYDELWPPMDAVDGADASLYTDQFDLEIARCLVFGQKPMVANFHPDQLEHPRLARSLGFFKEACLLHEALEDYLVFGSYLGSPDLGVPPFEVSCLSKGVYTLPGQSRTMIRRVPSVLASSWQGSDGSFAMVLANVSRQAQCVRFGGLRLGVAGEVLRIEPSGDRCRKKKMGAESIKIRGKHVLGLKSEAPLPGTSNPIWLGPLL